MLKKIILLVILAGLLAFVVKLTLEYRPIRYRELVNQYISVDATYMELTSRVLANLTETIGLYREWVEHAKEWFYVPPFKRLQELNEELAGLLEASKYYMLQKSDLAAQIFLKWKGVKKQQGGR